MAASNQIGSKARSMPIGLLAARRQAVPTVDPPAGLCRVDVVDPSDEPALSLLVSLSGRQQTVVVDKALQLGPRAREREPVLVRVEHLVQTSEHDGARGENG